MENKKLIEKEKWRNRLDSVPIITGMGEEESRELDRKKMREEEKKNEEKDPKDREMNLLEVEQSRERKRSRTEADDSETERMEIIKDVTDEHMCLVETRVISGLIENVEEEKVISLIECFNPIIRSSPDHIKQTMLECSEKWENKKNVYIGAINYIAHGRQEERGMEEQLKERSLESLCEILTREIENRMPKHCGTCEARYIVKLNDKPVIHCMWCKVGMHDCTESNNGIKNGKGIKWLCKTCEPVFNKYFLPKLDQAAFFEGFEIKKKNLCKENKKSVEPEVKKSIVPQEVVKQVEEQKDSLEKDKTEEPIIIIEVEGESAVELEVNESAVDGNKESNKKNERNEKTETTKEICWFWKNKKCRYTTNCKHAHPEQCKEMLETGRCKDNRCKLIHPKICRNLFFNGYCPRGESSCWFTHPSKCQNNPPKNIMDYSYTGNQNLYSNSQNQNMNSQNVSPHFLGAWPTLTNVNNHQKNGMSQNPSMIQMMQNMMEKLTQMDSKIVHLERGRQMFY